MAYIIVVIRFNAFLKNGNQSGEIFDSTDYVGKYIKNLVFGNDSRKVESDSNVCEIDHITNTMTISYEFEVFENERSECLCEEFKKKFMNLRPSTIYSPSVTFKFSPYNVVMSDGYDEEESYEDIKEPNI